MKLSTRARYALRAMAEIGKESDDDNPINLSAIAKKTDISHRYLEQVAISLKNAKLLKAVPGKHGGHMLARTPEDISLREIVEAAIGEINVVDCVLDPDSCDKSDDCDCRDVYCLINRRIRESLSEYNLKDLMEGRIEA